MFLWVQTVCLAVKFLLGVCIIMPKIYGLAGRWINVYGAFQC